MTGGLKQIILEDAGLPGEAGSVFSALQTLTVTTDANSIITDVGELLFKPMAANVSLQFQETEVNWSTLIAAGGSQWFQFFSDGANLRLHSADTSTTRQGTYYIIQ